MSLLHQRRDVIEELVSHTSRQLHQMKLITQRWTAQEKWTRLLRRWLGGKWLPGLPEEARRLLSG